MNAKNIKRLYMDDETKLDFEKVWFKSFYRKEIGETKTLSRGIIVPALRGYNSGGILQFECAVLDEKGVGIEGSGMFGTPVCGNYFTPPPNDNISENYPLIKDIPFVDKDVIFAGRLFLHYGHFLLQSLTRLYCYLKNRNKDLYIAWTIGKGESLPKFALDFFNLLKIPQEKIILTQEMMRFRNVFCPSISSRMEYKTGENVLSSENYCDWTDDFLLPFKEAAKNVAPAKYKKVYLTRKYWTNIVQCLGEQDIERVFVKNGFKSIAPEKLSLKEQIAIYKGADEIAGISGSVFHTALFRDRPKLKLIILNRNEEFTFQYIVNEAIEADCYVIKAYANPFPVSNNGPFIMGMTSYLKEFLRDHGLKDFNAKLDIDKYLKDFCLIYANVYSQSYHQETLLAASKNSIDAIAVIRALRVSTYSLAFRVFYYFLYHITFGALKIKYKNRHRALKSFAGRL